MRLKLFSALLVLLVLAGSSYALPSLSGFRGVHRVGSGRTIGQNEIAFGLMPKYWASTNEVDNIRFFAQTQQGFFDTLLNVKDKEHLAIGYFVVDYGATDWLEIATRLTYKITYYERDLVQPRGFSAGRWDGNHGVSDTRVGIKAGFSPTPSNQLLWLGIQHWYEFAPPSNEIVTSEDDCGRWFDDMPMFEMRSPMLSTGHTTMGVDGLITLDLAGVSPGTPLRFHANAGYAMYKQSFNMTDFRYSYGATEVNFYDSTDVSMRVEDDVLNLGFAAEFPTQYATVFTEYTVHELLSRDGYNSVAYFTPGIRFHTNAGFLLDVAFDLGLTEYDPDYYDLGHALYQQGPVSEEDREARAPLPTGATQDWGIGFGLAFSSDLMVEEIGPTQGTISGMVMDARTGGKLQGTLTFAGVPVDTVRSDPVTGYFEVDVPPGSIPITVMVEGYEPASATIVLEAGQNVVKDFQMRPEAAAGMITGTVIDAETGEPVMASISVTGPEEPVGVECNEDGVFQFEAPEGTWTIKAEHEDYVTRTKPVVVPADQSVVVDFELRPALQEGQVMTFSNIYFDVASATLKPESYPVLNNIVELLKENSTARIQIAGHTDSDGSASYNQTLSEQRAASVFNYLVSNGINPNRLTTMGFGESQPAVPNTSAANKAQNRRIEFTVLSI